MRQRLRAFAALGASTTTLALFATSSPVTVSRAAWHDSEWATAPLGVVECGTANYETRAEGTLLSGSLLGIDLDDVLDVHSMLVTNDGEGAQPVPAGAQSSGPNAYRNPFDVEAFDELDLELGTVRDVVQLPLGTEAGVLAQYGEADPYGNSAGASGLVNDSGIIDLDPGDPTPPDLATVSVMTLASALSPGLGSVLGDVTDVSLETGAVAARAQLDACAEDFGADGLTREYAVSHVDTVVESELLSDLYSALEATVTSLANTVNTLTGEQVVGPITTGLRSVLDRLIGGLSDVSVDIEASIDLSDVTDVLETPISDPDGVLTLHPSSGHVRVHTDSLLAAAFSDGSSDALNELPPNTSLLTEPAVAIALERALVAAVASWVGSLQTAIDSAIDGIGVDASVGMRLRLLGLLPVVTVTASLSADLGDLEYAEVSLSGGLLGLGLLDIENALIGEVGGIVKDALEGVLASLTSEIDSTLAGAADTLVPVVTGAYSTLFLDGLVDITVNAQNAPSSGNPGPTSWDALPEGQYDVAAIRIGILDALGDLGVELFLGRASVGPGSAITGG